MKGWFGNVLHIEPRMGVLFGANITNGRLPSALALALKPGNVIG